MDPINILAIMVIAMLGVYVLIQVLVWGSIGILTLVQVAKLRRLKREKHDRSR
jgi:hypothetical protein